MEADQRLFSTVRNDEHHVLHWLFLHLALLVNMHSVFGPMASLFRTRTITTSFVEFHIETYSVLFADDFQQHEDQRREFSDLFFSLSGAI